LPDAREVPKAKHLTGKIFTQRIECNNLTPRTRIKRLARKTIRFHHPHPEAQPRPNSTILQNH
ncbi:IS1 family transposase, partial [Escherichia coli]|uniref:IS1 family transposase n=1 Tax=Escherichia coli TaxID=562 RepID=UPI001BDB7581